VPRTGEESPRGEQAEQGGKSLVEKGGARRRRDTPSKSLGPAERGRGRGTRTRKTNDLSEQTKSQA
jgi:hypothetical protein